MLRVDLTVSNSSFARLQRCHNGWFDEVRRQAFSEFSGTIMSDYIGAIDQGTTSTRFMVFDRAGKVVASAQKEHRQIYPQAGWVEHSADEIWLRTQAVIA